jgi:flagellar basal body-associated protein FliL
MSDDYRVKYQRDLAGIGDAVGGAVSGYHHITAFYRHFNAVVICQAGTGKKNKIFGFPLVLMVAYGCAGGQGQFRHQPGVLQGASVHKMGKGGNSLAAPHFFLLLDPHFIPVVDHILSFILKKPGTRPFLEPSPLLLTQVRKKDRLNKMKRIEERSPPFLLILYRVLVALLLFVILVILAGTLYGLIARPGRAAPEIPAPRSEGEEKIFTGLGRIRASTSQGATVILSVAFPYDPADLSFAEELASRIAELRRITVEYFGGLSAEAAGEQDEGALKEELLRRYNAVLRLGSLKTLYFNDFMIVE